MNKDVFRQMPFFQTDSLTIREFDESDFDDYIKWHCDGEITYYTEGLYNFKQGDKDSFVKFFTKRVPRMYATKESGIWCISGKSDNKNIGLVEVCKFDAYSNHAQIHYCMSKEHRNRGYASQAVRCMLGWAFGEAGLNRVYTYADEKNAPSRRVLEKAGFTLEGITRQSNANKYTKRGELIKETLKDSRFISEKQYNNCCIYGILKHEFI